jgi:hypothetical protein
LQKDNNQLYNPLWNLDVKVPKGASLVGEQIDRDRRSLILQSLLLSDSDYDELGDWILGKKNSPPRHSIELELVKMEEGIDGDSFHGVRDLDSIFSDEMRLLRNAVFASPRFATQISEAQDKNKIYQWAKEVYDIMSAGPAIHAVEKLMKIHPEHPRSLIVDGLLAMFGRSVNSIQGLWDHRIGDVGIKNPLANLATKTGFLDNCMEEALLNGILDVWLKLEETGRVAGSVNEFVTNVQQYRRYCLSKGSIVNPFDLLIEDLFERLGFKHAGKKRFISFKNGRNVLSTEFLHTFHEKNGKRKLAVKYLYGDSGADHKAEEMAGRLFLCPYLIRNRISRAQDIQEWTFIFVPEGKWRLQHIELLKLAGWVVVEAEALERYLQMTNQETVGNNDCFQVALSPTSVSKANRHIDLSEGNNLPMAAESSKKPKLKSKGGHG